MRKITESKRFREATKTSFEDVDFDGSGSLDYKELYIALLLFYDKMNSLLPVHVEVCEIQQINSQFEIDDKLLSATIPLTIRVL